MTIALTDVSFNLKEWYHDQRTIYQTFKNNPFLDSLKRNPNAGGEVDPVPLLIGESQGIAQTSYATALSSAGAPTGAKFAVTYGEQMIVAKFDNKVIDAGRKNPHAFMDSAKLNIDATLKRAGIDLSAQVWGLGGGSLGVAATVTASTNTVVLSDPDQIINFSAGMVIAVSDANGADSGDSLRSGTVTVATVNRNAGSFTYTGTDISGFTTGDHIFRAGAFAGDVSQVKHVVGLQKWIPYTASPDTLFSQSRTTDSLLFGCSTSGVTDVESGNIIDRISKTAAFHNSRYGASPTECWVHNRQWNKASITMQQQGVRPIDVRNWTGTINYKAIEMACGNDMIQLRGDRHAPTTRAYFVNPEFIELRSILSLMRPLAEDGLELRWNTASGFWQYDWVSYPQLVITNPAEFAVTALPAL